MAKLPLTDAQAEKALPVVSGAFRRAQAELSMLRFEDPRGALVSLSDDELVAPPAHRFLTFDLEGDVEGTIALACPVALAAVIAGGQLGLDDEELQTRRDAGAIGDEDAAALESAFGHIGAGLAAEVGDSTLHAIEVSFGESRAADEWSAPDTFEEALLAVTMRCVAGGHLTDDITCLMPRSVATDLFGTAMEPAGEEPDPYGGEHPGGGAPRTIVGIGLGVQERKLLRQVQAAHDVELHIVDDVRDLLSAVVNFECAGIVIGDKTVSNNAKVFDINVATLKRLRAHPKGRDLPVFYLVHWPIREHVLQVAQLGVRDIIGQPAKPADVERRLETFIDSTLSVRARQAA